MSLSVEVVEEAQPEESNAKNLDHRKMRREMINDRVK